MKKKTITNREIKIVSSEDVMLQWMDEYMIIVESPKEADRIALEYDHDDFRDGLYIAAYGRWKNGAIICLQENT